MLGEEARRSIGSGVVLGLGLAFAAISLVHLSAGQEPLLSLVTGVLFPLLLSLSLVYAGYRLNGGLGGPDRAWLVARDAVVGAVAGMLLGVGLVAYEVGHDTVLADAEYLLPNSAVVGSVVGVLVSYYHEAWREKARELKRTRERMERAQETADVGHWDLDLERRVVSASGVLRDIFGVDGSGDIPFSVFAERVHPGDRERFEEAHLEWGGDGEDFELNYRVCPPDGGIKRVHEIASVQVEEGEAEVLQGTVQDVTKERRLENTLEAVNEISQSTLGAEDEEELIRSAEKVLTERRKYGCTAIGLLDEEGELEEIYNAGNIADTDVRCNAKWGEIYSKDYLEEVLEEGILEIEDVTEPPYQQHEEGEDSHGAMALALEYKGREYGAMTLHYALEDISEEEKRLLRELAKNVAAGLFSIRTEEKLERERDELRVLNRIVRHDIRNDINLVMAWASELQDEVDGELRERYVDPIMDTGSDVISLTETAREFVETIEEGEDADLNSVKLHEVLEEELDSRRARFPGAEFSVEGELPRVAVRANDLLSAVFRNLLNNSVQHNDKENPEVVVEVEKEGEEVVVAVEDNGPGIPEEMVDEIFGRGEKGLESEGTGVGLYLVEKLVDIYGGEVNVEGGEEGTVFEVRLEKAPLTYYADVFDM